jgi:hypothetical protein
VWQAYQYLAGSISSEAPYEVQYCLEAALREWAKKDCLITTGFTYGPLAYHFNGLDPWKEVKALVPSFSAQHFDRVLVLIGVPRLYRHKPIFCIPLFHELGHFVDRHVGVVAYIRLNALQQGGSFNQVTLPPLHWAEHFADLFAACYVGRSSTGLLEAVVPNAPANQTHPASKDRIDLVEKFVNGISDPRLTAFEIALKNLGAPALKIRHTVPNLTSAYNDVRPVDIKSAAELHGLFDAAWSYFSVNESKPVSPMTNVAMSVEQFERTVNDLTEKSIRNYSTKEMWKAHAAP